MTLSYYLDVYSDLPGQNTSPPQAHQFNYHAVVTLDHAIYDPSYGESYAAGTADINDSLRLFEINFLRAAVWEIIPIWTGYPNIVKNVWPSAGTNLTYLGNPCQP